MIVVRYSRSLGESPELHSTGQRGKLEKIAAETEVNVMDLMKLNLAFNGA